MNQKMEAQYAEAKGELLSEVNGKTTTLTIKEFAPAGVKIQSNQEIEVKGRYSATRAATTDALLKADGTGEWETRAIDLTGEGEMIMVTAKGTMRQESPGIVRWEGDVSYKTPSQKLAWLNSTRARTEGTTKMVTGEMTGKTYAK